MTLMGSLLMMMTKMRVMTRWRRLRFQKRKSTTNLVTLMQATQTMTPMLT